MGHARDRWKEGSLLLLLLVWSLQTSACRACGKTFGRNSAQVSHCRSLRLTDGHTSQFCPVQDTLKAKWQILSLTMSSQHHQCTSMPSLLWGLVLEDRTWTCCCRSWSCRGCRSCSWRRLSGAFPGLASLVHGVQSVSTFAELTISTCFRWRCTSSFSGDFCCLLSVGKVQFPAPPALQVFSKGALLLCAPYA